MRGRLKLLLLLWLSGSIVWCLRIQSLPPCPHRSASEPAHRRPTSAHRRACPSTLSLLHPGTRLQLKQRADVGEGGASAEAVSAVVATTSAGGDADIPDDPASASSSTGPTQGLDALLASPRAGFLALNAVAVLWGTQHVIIKQALSSPQYGSASLLNFWRFFLSAALFSPALLRLLQRDEGRVTEAESEGDSDNDEVREGKDENTATTTIDTNTVSARTRTLRAGAELGLYTFLGFGFQAIGLETTTASRSAFLLYLNVKFVPFLAALLLGRRISPVTWRSAALALAGTCLLSTDGGPATIGDLWCACAAVASAMFILRLEALSKSTDAAELNAVSAFCVAVLCGVWVGGDLIFGQTLGVDLGTGGTVERLLAPLRDPAPVIYLGLVTTALCTYLQTLGQRVIPAERAAVIYSADPVYGAFFSWLLLGEKLGPQGFCGAGLILLGIYVSNSGGGEKSDSGEGAGTVNAETVGAGAVRIVE
ncbi:EamA-like transporter family-domain-containing protein [Ochromonadaceae sp. CCMP2298]|nr:EamA-like transporter family-domain-containing protein [Ochromonadaceae sp. CCMP2298]